MVTQQTAGAFDSATTIYLGWVDASLNTSARITRVARAWFDETLGAQRDFATSMHKAWTDAQTAVSADDAPTTPVMLLSRTGEIARQSYALWTEAGLKAQERYSRLAESTFEEMRGVQTEITQRATEQNGEIAKRTNSKATR